MDRSLAPSLLQDLDQKLVLLSGPRQVGKTTLARSLFPKEVTEYLNFDSAPDRKIISQQAWRKQGAELVVFDELHKMRQWKSWIKGVYDTLGTRPRLLVTGSARLDIFRRGEESLAGRYFSHRLHPFSVAELKGELSAEETLDRLLRLGGFPEPFLSNSEKEAQRWRRSHIDRIIREDILDLKPVRELRSLEILVDLLSERVGSSISYASLAEDLSVSPHTVKSWIEILEALFVVFTVRPYSERLARTLRKEPKIYFYDTGRVKNDPGARFENVVACALLKRMHFLEDTQGTKCQLHFIRDKEKREVDFLTLVDGRPEWLIEAKFSDGAPSPALRYYSQLLPGATPLQLVRQLSRETQHDRIRIVTAAHWLQGLES